MKVVLPEYVICFHEDKLRCPECVAVWEWEALADYRRVALAPTTAAYWVGHVWGIGSVRGEFVYVRLMCRPEGVLPMYRWGLASIKDLLRETGRNDVIAYIDGFEFCVALEQL